MKLAVLKNIMVQALKPRRFAVMIGKVFERVAERHGKTSNPDYMEWIRCNLSDFAALAQTLDSSLWQESVARSREIELSARKTLKLIPHDLGGGGVYPFLHFLVRYIKPRNIVETGVAAGFSSFAFLDALEMNGSGRLYSSDFPYFRLPHPEQYIGILVPAELRGRWHLHIDGDQRNLAQIALELNGAIDLFHYDSDKSYIARKRAVSAIESRLGDDAFAIMDEIQDNFFAGIRICTRTQETLSSLRVRGQIRRYDRRTHSQSDEVFPG